MGKVLWNGEGSPRWRTPQATFDLLHSHFHFTHDACASDTNHLLPNYWTAEQDCLKQDWTGCRLFINPPFSGLPTKIVKKTQEAELVCMLLMLNQLTLAPLKNHAPDWILIPHSRIKFWDESRPDEKTKSSPAFGTAALLWAKECPEQIEGWRILK